MSEYHSVQNMKVHLFVLIWMRHVDAECFYSVRLHSHFLSRFYHSCLSLYESRRVADIQLWSHFSVGRGENSRVL